MQRLQASDFLVRRPLGEREPHEAHPFAALALPAHGRSIGRLLELAGDGLPGGGELPPRGSASTASTRIPPACAAWMPAGASSITRQRAAGTSTRAAAARKISGAAADVLLAGGEEDEASEPAVIEVSYGYSRDHREDLKQWMLALVTS